MGLFNKGVKGNYLIVIHRWFVSCSGWGKQRMLCDVTRDEADAKAALIEQAEGDHTSVRAFKIPDHVMIVEKQDVSTTS